MKSLNSFPDKLTGKSVNRREFIKFIGKAAIFSTFSAGYFLRCSGIKNRERPNVLFIVVDDLRPQLACYGHRKMNSPYIDELAGKGTVFKRTYCQVPVCGASRASLLTGVRPTRRRFTDYKTYADVDLPENLTLPEYLRMNGYYTISLGKVFHHRDDGKGSWSETAWRPAGDWTGRGYLDERNRKLASAEKGGRALPYESMEVDDEVYPDGKLNKKAIAELKRLKDLNKPFFLAVGYLKPHLPFNAPKKYWDLYPHDEIDLADNPFRPKGAPDAALHNWGELRKYYGIPKKGPLSDDLARVLIHGYYACVSYVDTLIGKLLEELKRLDLEKNTIVILWGDHGWNLGEHGLWCKHCNFETSLHSPLILTTPWHNRGQTSLALTEFVDIYPTICELCGLLLPEHLEGLSMAPLLSDPSMDWKKAVFSRYKEGESVKTDRYRYTEWTNDSGSIYARMLYDHFTDPFENVNISETGEYTGVVDELSSILRKGWRSQLPV